MYQDKKSVQRLPAPMKPKAPPGSSTSTAPPVYRPAAPRQLLQSKTEAVSVPGRAPALHHAGQPLKPGKPQPLAGQVPKPMLSKPSSKISVQQKTAPTVSRSPQPVPRAVAQPASQTSRTVQARPGNYATLRIGERIVHTAGTPHHFAVPMVHKPVGGTHNTVQPATATLYKGDRQYGSPKTVAGATKPHAELAVLQAKSAAIAGILTTQDDADTLGLKIEVDTQVCDDCCKWFDTNLISWLKNDVKVGSGKKAKPWKGTFSLKIEANGGSKTISGKADTIAGLGSAGWAPVGEGGYK